MYHELRGNRAIVLWLTQFLLLPALPVRTIKIPLTETEFPYLQDRILKHAYSVYTLPQLVENPEMRYLARRESGYPAKKRRRCELSNRYLGKISQGYWSKSVT